MFPEADTTAQSLAVATQALNLLRQPDVGAYTWGPQTHTHTRLASCAPEPLLVRTAIPSLAIPIAWHDKDCSAWWLYLAAVTGRPFSIEHSIFAHFFDIEQIHAIYVQDVPQVYNVFVLLRQDEYDDELMDDLLDREAEILELNPDRLFSFQYLPLLADQPTRPVPTTATLILYG